MLNIPHKPPILFAKRVLVKNNDFAKIEIEFDTKPNLSMFIEAAAQSCGAFLNEEKIGYVLSVSDTTLHVSSNEKVFVAHIIRNVSSEDLNEVIFEIKNKEILIVSGKLLLMLDKSSYM